MIPNISENPRGRKTPKRGRKLRFDPAIFEDVPGLDSLIADLLARGLIEVRR